MEENSAVLICAVQGLLVPRAEVRPWSIAFISINVATGIQWIILMFKAKGGLRWVFAQTQTAVFMTQPFHLLCFSVWLFLFTPCAWIYHRQLDKAVILQVLVVQVIKRHAQSTLKSRKEHKNVLQLYKIIMKNNTYGGLHLIIIKWSLSYLVISKSFQRKKYLFFSGFSIYSSWMEEIYWRAECGYYLSNLPFKQHPLWSSWAPWQAGTTVWIRKGRDSKQIRKGCNPVAPRSLCGGRMNGLNPQAGIVNVHSLPFMASRSEDRTGPARVKTGQEILLFMEYVTFQHWDEGVGGTEIPDEAKRTEGTLVSWQAVLAK